MSYYATQSDYTVSIYKQRDCRDDSTMWQIVVETGSRIKTCIEMEHEELSGALTLLEKCLQEIPTIKEEQK